MSCSWVINQSIYTYKKFKQFVREKKREEIYSQEHVKNAFNTVVCELPGKGEPGASGNKGR